MYDLIRCVLERVSAVLAPRRSGRHRARPAGTAPSPYPLPLHGPVRAPRRPAPRTLPRARSPYGEETLLDIEAVAFVRPYLVAHERAQQRQRRRTLVMAAHFGIDLDTRVIHCAGVR